MSDSKWSFLVQFLYILVIAGIWTHVGANVNLTRQLTKIVPWEHVHDIDLYDTMGAKEKFAYCGTGRCMLAQDVQSPPRFWNRLNEKCSSILLTGIQEDDEGLEMRVKIHLKESAFRSFTLRIRLNSPPGTFNFCRDPFFPFNIKLFDLSQIRRLELKLSTNVYFITTFFNWVSLRNTTVAEIALSSLLLLPRLIFFFFNFRPRQLVFYIN